MLRALVAVALVVALPSMAADRRVRGYVKRDGSYVESHYRTKENRSKEDNYSTKGNVNPYTGKKGTKNP